MKHTYSLKEMQSTGIYKISCIINNKFYIGSASCVKTVPSKKGFSGRFYSHISSLRKNKHKNNKLQNAFNKYGENNFTFEIIEFCNPEDCTKKEQSWLDNLKPFGENGYNICKNALVNNYIGRQKVRKYNRNNENINSNLKHPIIQKDLLGNFIREFSGMTEASRICKIHRMSISSCCRGIYHKAGGFKWEYKYPENAITKQKNIKFNVRLTNLETNEVFIYPTINSLIKVIDFCKSTISLYINNGEILQGKYKFEKIFI